LASHLDLSLVCDYAADLAHSPIPAIVIAGDRDPATGSYGSEVPDLQHVRRFTIPGAGHLAHHEDADQVRRLLATAIEALLDRARG
jgi:pimeloyl-ACP methyl ester carboxylesterase